MSVRTLIATIVSSIAFGITANANASTIKKCQDATGKWHYGDTAAAECAKSKIEVLSDTGVKEREIAAPPTEEELKERAKNKEAMERQRKLEEDRKKRDQILLQSYPHEDDLLLYRDRKLSQLESTVTSSEATLTSLRKVLERLQAQKQSEIENGNKKELEQTEKSIAQTTAQIEKHEAVIEQTRKEQEKLRQQFDEDLQRYRELKRTQPAADKPAQAP